MSTPVFSLLYTSRRAKEIARVVNLWIDSAARPETLEIILAIDSDYKEGLEMARKLVGYPLWKGATLKLVESPVPGNCVKGWNTAAAASTGKVLIAIADDFVPPPQFDFNLTNIHPHWIDTECVVKVSDGYNSNLCTLGIITRHRYERFGYFFYYGYQSLFSDTELTYRAIQDNVLLKAEQLVFEHLHPDANKRERDSIDLNHASQARWDQGEQLFNYRQLRGFPLDDGPMAIKMTPTGIGLEEYAVFCQAIKDDFCLYDVMHRMVEEGVTSIFITTPDEYWSGDTTPASDIEEVKQVVARLVEDGVNVHHRVIEVGKYRQFKLHRAGTETMVRNEALAWIRSYGFKHIFVVDGDELWRKGLATKVDRLVRAERPTAVSCGMVPVIGLPGLPIRDAKDKVTVYMRSDVSFRECRSPFGLQREMPELGVIHFSATRKSMDEIVIKMKASGHYDDPSYDFASFIYKILPNVKPGSKDLHMYTRYQIWPEAGVWSQPEMDDIPISMRPYLSTEIGPEYVPPIRVADEAPPALQLKVPMVENGDKYSLHAAPSVTASNPQPARTPHGVLKTNHPRRQLRRW